MSSFLWLCCTLSGAAALALEVLWVRSAGLILGTTTATTATVLACYFAGLGGGAAWARRVSRWPVRLYGLLELGVGTGALWSYVVLHALASKPAQVWLTVLGPVGRTAAVAVALLPATLCLGATLPVLGGSAAATNERRQGLLPLLLHPDPHRVAFIGLATGMTASAGPALGVPETVVVELVPEVAQAARTQFATWNAHVLEQPSVHLVLDDGRHYLAVSRAAFDVIVSDLFVPWHASAGNLYAREMYDLVARHLAPGGVFCQWLPLYQLTREEFDMLVHTFLTVFPQAALWRGDFFPDRPIVALVGRFNGHMPDLEYLRRRLQQLPAWGRDTLLASPRGLLMLYAGDLRAVADLFAAAPLNTDDRPQIEFLAPRLTRMTRAGDKDWFTGEALATFYDTLAGRLADTPALSHALSEDMLTAWRAGLALSHYALAAARHDDAMAARWQAQVATPVPEVIRAAETEDERTGVAAAQRQLQKLRNEQEQVRQHLEDMERRLQEMTSSTQGQP
jgi:hypothetical protein